MNIKMPRPKITILDLIQIVITQRLIYVRCISIGNSIISSAITDKQARVSF